jgi:malate dehydrogenase (oxaloacetate-decarboxylating)(NADP+)
LLHRYRKRICCFNDDIQGTATICLAGLLSALRATSASLADQRVLFLGAGEAGTGIAELIAIAVERGYGLSREEGRRRCYFVDSKGLVCAARTDLQPHKRPFAWDLAPCTTLLEAVRQLRPTALIGVSTSQGAFSREVLTLMGEYNQRPIIFPLSNPTSKSECTFEEAFDATQGRVLFASGSPFPPLQHGSRVYTPAQANNAYCFPAIGYAAVLCRASEISDDAFLLAAETLAGITPIADLEVGFLFPRFAGIRDVSARLIAVIAHDMCRRGSGTLPDDFPKPLVSERGRLAQLAQWEAYVKTHMFASAPAARL